MNTEILSAAGEWLWLGRLAVVAAMGAVAAAVWMGTARLLARRAQNTENVWDDILLSAARPPVWLVIFMTTATFAGEAVLPAFGESWDADWQKVRAGFFWLASFWLLLRLVSQTEKRLHRLHRADPLTRLMPGDSIDARRGLLVTISRAARVVIVVIAALTALDSLGISISGLLAFGGLGGVVVALAVRDMLGNLFSGMMLFWDRPFMAGDWIRCPALQVEGVVESVGWRITVIRTFEKRPLYIPNSLLTNNIIENPQRMTNRRIYEMMGVRYEDGGKLPAILADVRKMAATHPELDQEQFYAVNFDKYADSSLQFFIYAMTRTTDWKKFLDVKEDVLMKVADIVAAHGAEFAFPTRTVHHIGAPPGMHAAPSTPPPQAVPPKESKN